MVKSQKNTRSSAMSKALIESLGRVVTGQKLLNLFRVILVRK